MINVASEAGGGLEARINGDTSQITELSRQIASMNEVLADREKALAADLRRAGKRDLPEHRPGGLHRQAVRIAQQHQLVARGRSALNFSGVGTIMRVR